MRLRIIQKFFSKFFEHKQQKTQNFCLILAEKGHHEFIPLPVNLDFAAHLSEYNPDRYGFGVEHPFVQDKALFFLGLLSSIPARNGDLIDADGFVPIHMATVRGGIKDIKLYVDYLIKTGILVCRKGYIPGEKSRGYKWAARYEGQPFTTRSTPCKYADKVTLYDDSNDKIAYPYLFHWYEQQKLSTDPLAEQYAFAIKEMKMQDSSRASWDRNSDTGGLKFPITQYQAAIRNIGKIRFHHYEPHIDTNIHRLHSVLTNLQKDYRNFLNYDGQSLVSVDIKNCQPYLACLILKPEFWQENSPLPLSIHTLPYNITTTLHTPPSLPIMIGKFFDEVNPESFDEFFRLVSYGGMYEKIAEVANSRIKELPEPISRKDAKTLMFHLLFSRNHGSHKDFVIRQMRQIFEKELFPKVSEFFRLLKTEFPDVAMEKQHNRLSCLLQSIESSIILHRCCKRIWEEMNQQVPIFTIHDSIVTIPKYQNYIVHVMIEEFSRCIGVAPTLSIEKWEPTNLNLDLLSKIKAS